MLEIHPTNELEADESTVRKFSPWFTGFHSFVGLPFFLAIVAPLRAPGSTLLSETEVGFKHKRVRQHRRNHADPRGQ